MSRARSTTASTAGSTAGSLAASTSSKSPAVSFIDSKIPGSFLPYPDVDGTSPTTSTQLSMASRVHERRPEFTRPQACRIRVGSWNVAAFKGTELDLAGWFVRGKGVSEALSGMSLSDKNMDRTEGFEEQEARWSKYQSTIPKHDPGSLPAGEEVGIYALGLQEVVDISSAAEALRPYTDPAPANKFKEAVQSKLPPGYQLVAERQLIGLLLLIWASPTVLPQISWTSTTSVGTGLMGYMGNKGAVTARIVLGGTTRLIFINSHLSAGTGKAEAERRNWDAQQVEARTRFDPITDDAGIQHGGEKIGDEDFAFWFGDLNYRLEGIPPEDVRRLLMLHTQNEYDVGSKSNAKIEHEIGSQHGSSLPSISTASSDHQKSNHDSHDQEYHMSHQTEDPASLQTTIDSLLSHDELIQQMHGQRMFHDGWREGPITFLPTYKYDRGTVGVFDTTEKKRGPSWCDRILYRTRKDLQLYNDTVLADQVTQKQNAELKAQGINPSLHEDETLFDYDPDADADDSFEEQPEALPGSGNVKHVTTKEGHEDTIKLEYYITHQRVLSSDHKPIDAGFLLKYDAIVPELKAKVQQEVARELDKAENEGRPIITLVVDSGSSDPDVNSAFDGADFGKLRYDEPKLRTITVANTGPVPAHFGFAIRPQDAPSISPRWLKIRFEKQTERITKEHKQTTQDAQEWYDSVPHVYSLAPGDSCNVNLVAEIADKDLVHSLNSHEHLEDVLVLRVKDGRDQFLALRADWQKSSHGHTLDRLLRVPEGGVRKLQNQHPEGKWRHRFGLKSSKSSGDHGGSHSRSLSGTEAGAANDGSGSGRASFEVEEEEVRWSAPREIFRLTEEIEALIERACAEWSMLGPSPSTENPLARLGYPFLPSSWTLMDAETRRTNRVCINEALDTNTPFSSHLAPTLPLTHRIEIFAETLVLFLSNMHGGIITPTLFAALEAQFFDRSTRAKLGAAGVEEQRARVLEIVDAEEGGGSCKTCFVLLMSSLGRMCAEIGAASVEVGAASQSQGPMGKVGGFLLKRMQSYDATAAAGGAGSRDASVVRERICKKWAEVFALAVVHVDGMAPPKGAYEERRRDLIELFLRAS